MSQCKFSLYLKKAGLASRNIVTFKPLFYVVSVSASFIISILCCNLYPALYKMIAFSLLQLLTVLPCVNKFLQFQCSYVTSPNSMNARLHRPRKGERSGHLILQEETTKYNFRTRFSILKTSPFFQCLLPRNLKK